VSGQKLWSLPSNSGPAKLLGAVTSPDGDRLALIPDGKSRKFLQLRPGEARVSVALPQEDDSLTGVAFGPPGSTFAAFGRKSGVTFYTPDTLEPWGTEGTGRGVQAARWSPNGLLLATADLDGNVTLWTDRTPRTIQLPGIAASELRFSDDSLYLVAAGRDGSLLAWSTATADPIGPWHLGLGARAELTLSREKAPSHEIMAHSPAAGALSFYNLETGATRQEPDCLPTEHATSLGLSARGHSLLLAAGQGPAALCDLTSGKLVARLAPGEATPQSAASYDLWGQRVATVAAEGEGSVVRVRETATGQVLFVLPFPDNRPASLRLLFTASGLVVSREEGASFHPLKDCSALDLRLVEQNNVLGWLATDRAGRFDGDSPGRMLAWVRGPGGRLVERPERDKHRVPGLMLGVRPASPPPRSQPSEDED
jgi:WD40 repeat protein